MKEVYCKNQVIICYNKKSARKKQINKPAIKIDWFPFIFYIDPRIWTKFLG